MIEVGANCADVLLRVLGTGAVHGSLLALATFFLSRTILRRAHPSWQAALWTLVILKFLVPLGPQSPLSLSSLVGALSSDPVAKGPTFVEVGPGEPTFTPITATASTLAALLALGYLLVVGALLSRAFWRHHRRRRATSTLPAAPEWLQEHARELARRIGARSAQLRLSPAGTPHVLGLFRPILVLPSPMVHEPELRDAALAHEMAHLRRWDHAVRLLEIVVSSLYFFLPPIRWIRRALDDAREQACDRFAVQVLGLPARRYALFLVAAARGARVTPGLAMARPPLQLRVDALLHEPARPQSRRMWPLVGAWAGFALAGPSASAARAGDTGALVCVVNDAIGDRVLAAYPDADLDGDGVLSPDEICAHQLRMKKQLVDRMGGHQWVSQIDPRADRDGDGVLSPEELDRFAARFEIDLRPAASEMSLELDGLRSVPVEPRGVRLAFAEVSGAVCGKEPCREASGGDAMLLFDVADETP